MAQPEHNVWWSVTSTAASRRTRGTDGAAAFLQRLRAQEGSPTTVPDDGAVLAMVLTGDLVLPAGSAVWALLPGTTVSTLAAAELLR